MQHADDHDYPFFCKISFFKTSENKPLKLVTQKTLRLIAPPNISPPGGLVLGNSPQVQSKTKKNGKFAIKNKANPIDL